MGLQVGSNPVTDLKVGLTDINQVYVGTTKVWDRFPPDINYSSLAGAAGWNSGAATNDWSFNWDFGAGITRSAASFTLSSDFPGAGQYAGAYATVKSTTLSQLTSNTTYQLNVISGGSSDDERLIGRVNITNTSTGTVSLAFGDNSTAGQLLTVQFTTPSSGTIGMEFETFPLNYYISNNTNVQQAYITKV